MTLQVSTLTRHQTFRVVRRRSGPKRLSPSNPTSVLYIEDPRRVRLTSFNRAGGCASRSTRLDIRGWKRAITRGSPKRRADTRWPGWRGRLLQAIERVLGEDAAVTEPPDFEEFAIDLLPEVAEERRLWTVLAT